MDITTSLPPASWLRLRGEGYNPTASPTRRATPRSTMDCDLPVRFYSQQSGRALVSALSAPRGFPRQSDRWRWQRRRRSEEHTSELQSRLHLVCRLLLEKKKKK